MRRELEADARRQAGKPPETPEAMQRMLYDLRVHQIELEMQNEELRRAQVELDTARARYFDLYDLAPVGYCTLDDAGLIVGANLTAVTMLGVPRTKLLKRAFSRFVSTEDQPWYRRLLERAGRQSRELRMRSEGGDLFWANVVITSAPNELGLLERRLVMSDVSDRKAEEAAKLEGEARYRELFSRASDGIVIFTLDGTLVEVNAGFARMHGRSVDQLAHQRLSDLEVTAPTVSPAFVRRLLVGDTVRSEVGHRHAAGHTVLLEATFGQISVRGEPHALGLYRDVTEKKRLEAALAQNDRLASMGLLSAGIAHEINNPLAYVVGNLESLVQELPELAERSWRGAAPDGEALDELVGRARGALEGAERIKKIAQGLGAFSKMDRGNLERVDVNRALASAMTLAHNELKFRARLVTQLGELPPVEASEGKLVQVFLNVLLNAAQAIPDGFPEQNQITLRSWADGSTVFAEVVDTGRGIPAENLSLIFEPFFTSKPHGLSGSGLGLSVCKSLLSEFGGEIRAQSAPGRTSLLVQLKASTTEPAEEPSPPAVPQAVARGRVLIVDDEDNIRKVLARNLRTEHDVVGVASGAEAQELLEKDQHFDVILCDLMMEEMTGMDLHAWLLKTAPKLAARVVFMSGGAFTPTASDYLASFENELLSKPFDMRELIASLRRRVAAARN